jgi:hypothetical protein
MKLLFCIISLLGVALSATCPKYTCEKSPEVLWGARAELEKKGPEALKNWETF